MALTSAQLATIKADIAANSDLNAFPNNSDGNIEIAKLYNLTASPDYWVWASSITRSDVYHKPSASGTSWDWATYKAQSQVEQGAWTQMFMGDAGPIGNMNFRAGVKAIFSGSAAQNTQRDHVLACGRRKATRIEKLLAVAVVGAPANTGNDSGSRGATTNPDNLGFESPITWPDIEAARNS